ncbi:CBS domain-containing protein [Kistimonas asteriae]|uniref:CBS domain-containing protein n=1 Tax=Kistimonas asteriae TaxID=517724 RepID=UPI001BA80A76|nr:CBS domain-containing protein [Kistimonas asteriae]
MRSITVADCMTRRVVALVPEMEVVEAIRILLKHKITAAPVLDSNHKLVGILSESDCLSATLTSSYYSQDFGLVSEYMTASVMSAGEEDSVLDVYERFMKQRAVRVPVLDEQGRLVGILSPKDLMRAVLEFYEKPAA